MTWARRAVVVGGGIGGLATAIGLRRAGWDPVVLERAEAITGVGAGVSLWTNALAALDRLGVGAVRRLGTLQGGSGIRRPDGRWLVHSADSGERARRGLDLLMIHRARLVEELLVVLGADAVRTGVAVTGVDQDADGVVVRHDDGHETRGGLVVGADGVHSTVRRALWPEAPDAGYAGFTAWRGVTDAPLDVEGDAAETWGRGADFGVVPLVDGRVYWFGTANLPAGTAFGDEHTEVLARFGHWHRPIPDILRATSPAAVLRHDILHHRCPLPPMARGRVALVGDAAHAMCPNLGQGACLALEDAVELTARVRPDADPVPGLRAYDEVRRPRGESLVTGSARVGRLVQADGRVSVVLRDTLARVTPTRLAAARIARLVAWSPPPP